MAFVTDNLPLVVVDDLDISLVNSTFNADGDSNGMEFYAEVEAYWMSKVKILSCQNNIPLRFVFPLQSPFPNWLTHLQIISYNLKKAN